MVDTVDDEVTLEDAGRILSGQMATLSHLTVEQRERIDQAIEDHKEGRTTAHEAIKQRYGQWLTEPRRKSTPA